MKTEKVKISEVKSNPNNPRIIKDDKFRKLVQSIKDFPKMLEIRPIVVNNEMIVLGGNMRLKACKEAGLKEIHIIKADDLTEEQQKEFIIKDNVGFGEWDWEQLANEWDNGELSEWGLDIPNWSLGVDENNISEDDIDIEEEFDSIGISGTFQKIVITFQDSKEAENWIKEFSQYKEILKKQGSAWQINLTSQFI